MCGEPVLGCILLVLHGVKSVRYLLHFNAVQRRAHDYDDNLKQRIHTTVCIPRSTIPWLCTRDAL